MAAREWHPVIDPWAVLLWLAILLWILNSLPR